MSKFIKAAVKALDKIYGFDQGPTATDQMNLPAGIQMVHDVSREAEMASGDGLQEGWQQITTIVTHVGAGGLDTVLDLAAGLLAAGWDPNRQTAWLFDTVLLPTSATFFTSAWMPTPGGSPNPGTMRLWRRWTGELTRAAGGGTIAIPVYEYMNRPIRVFGPVAALVATTVVSGAVVLTFVHHFWIGALNVLPPHVA